MTYTLVIALAAVILIAISKIRDYEQAFLDHLVDFSLIFILGASILIHLLVFQFSSLVQDPFNPTAVNTSLRVICGFLWFGALVVVTIFGVMIVYQSMSKFS